MTDAPQYFHEGGSDGREGSDSEVEERSVRDSEAEESVGEGGGYELPPMMTETEDEDVPLLAASEFDEFMLTSNANPFSSQPHPGQIPASMYAHCID